MSITAISGLLTIALIMTNAGGEGKSTWAEILAAYGQLAGLNTIVSDVDPGNRGYLNRSGDDSALSLDWTPRDDADPSAPADPVTWYNTHLAGRQLAILDTGANMLAASNPINKFIGGLIAVARQNGARIIVYCVTSPNKPGSDDLVEMMYHRFRTGAEVVIVQNDRDGSRTFNASLATLGTPIVNLPHIDPGLQLMRQRRRIPLHDVLMMPEVGYERATAMVAQRLLRAAKQDSIIDVVGREMIAPLERIATTAPHSTFYRISDLDCAGNAAITANEKIAAAWDQFRQCDSDDANIFLTAAHALRDADQEWRNL